MNADKSRMYRDVDFLTGIQPPRNSAHPQSLNIVAKYIHEEFKNAGLEVREQVWGVDGVTYKNVIATYNGRAERRLIVGAHYDVCCDYPAADDNASGIAGLLETARLVGAEQPDLDYRLEFVAYCLEEPPFFGTEYMGSHIHAASLAEEQADILGMICYEMIGYFSEIPGSQPNPRPQLYPDFPDTGDFLTILGLQSAPEFNGKVTDLMLENEAIDTWLIELTRQDELAGLSDHINYWKYGYHAVMITDTAKVRNPNYHSESDTIDTLDFERMKEVVNSTYLAATGF